MKNIIHYSKYEKNKEKNIKKPKKSQETETETEKNATRFHENVCVTQARENK